MDHEAIYVNLARYNRNMNTDRKRRSDKKRQRRKKKRVTREVVSEKGGERYLRICSCWEVELSELGETGETGDSSKPLPPPLIDPTLKDP